MSRECAWRNLNLEKSDRWAHTEYSIAQHKDYLARKAGISTEDPEFHRKWKFELSIDFNFVINDGLIDWRETGRTTDMGHASYAKDGSDQREIGECPFKTLEDVWAFDAVKEYGLPEKQEQIDAYEALLRKLENNEPEVFSPGGTYKTLVSGAIQTFGWDMLLMGASDLDKMEKVFDSFFRRSRFFYECWAKTSAQAILTHDDFVWTCGAFMDPDFYRQVIIPRYAELWKIVHDAGKRVIFCADGNYTEFARDVVEAGADALIFEPMNDFDFMVDHFGQECCLIGSAVDCRDLTFNKWDQVKSDIDRTFEKLQDCKGAIVSVGNHLPANIPENMLDSYLDEVLKRLPK